FDETVVGMLHDGTSVLAPSTGGRPVRFEGFTVGCHLMAQSAPHDGEIHPDGDELLLVITGACSAVLDTADGDETVGLRAGDGFIVPQDTWHRVVIHEPSLLVFVTPGPRSEHRGLRSE
ncbi:MAG: cupin domain-containing protein, partial [Acidimicrobiia bacterium]